jgi:alginate O-acetyltransferase complex protein AlgI
MLFHTWTFVAFFAVFYPVWLAVKGTRYRDVWLLAASYVFYGWWNPLYLLPMIFSTAVDWLGVVAMVRTGRKKLCLGVTIANNLLLLGFFKYWDFFASGVNSLLASFGADWSLQSQKAMLDWCAGPFVERVNGLLAALHIPAAVHMPEWVLPVGISFYTFHSMSYTIDFYRGRITREPSFLRFATFVSLFSQLVAGPVLRAADLLPQLRAPARIAGSQAADGLSLFVVGLFKKVALADYLAMYVDKVYAAPGRFDAPALILATVAFGWQIYFDFSGYTDMARGIGRIIGFQIKRNFNHPYLADGLGDFWRRWHISLSSWFRDYVYIPLGGNRGGRLATYRNMALTMLISGLWHGAAWTFVIWGALHALGRVATRRLEEWPAYQARVPRLLRQAGVFAFVTFAWIFFRARTLDSACLVVSRIFVSPWTDPGLPMLMAFLVAGAWAYQHVFESRWRPALQAAPVRVAITVAMVLYLAAVPGGAAQPFIYFQF